MSSISIDPSESTSGFTSRSIPNYILRSLSEHSWTHWYHKPGKTDDWLEAMNKAAQRKLAPYQIWED